MAVSRLIIAFGKLSCHSTSAFRIGTGSLDICHANNISRLFGTSGPLLRNLDSHAVAPSTLPSSRNNRWIELKSFWDTHEYTVKHLPFPKTGGRGPNGRIWNHRRAGGNKRNYRMIDFRRVKGTAEMPNDGVLVEKVDKIEYDPNRSARIALVASGEHKRYVIATENMKPGDVIKSSQILTRSPVRPVDGDVYPLGSLPLGTLVCCVEKYPGAGGEVARAAGVSSLIVRRVDDKVVVLRLPSKREIEVSADCTATVGRVSNVDHNKRVIGKAGRNRWIGIRPKSGRWHRKTGRSGRKIKPPKPAIVYTRPPTAKVIEKRFSVSQVPGISQGMRY